MREGGLLCGLTCEVQLYIFVTIEKPSFLFGHAVIFVLFFSKVDSNVRN